MKKRKRRNLLKVSDGRQVDGTLPPVIISVKKRYYVNSRNVPDWSLTAHACDCAPAACSGPNPRVFVFYRNCYRDDNVETRSTRPEYYTGLSDRYDSHVNKRARVCVCVCIRTYNDLIVPRISGGKKGRNTAVRYFIRHISTVRPEYV